MVVLVLYFVKGFQGSTAKYHLRKRGKGPRQFVTREKKKKKTKKVSLQDFILVYKTIGKQGPWEVNRSTSTL